MESALTPSVTIKGGKGGTYGIVTASSQGNAKEIASVDESKHPSLTDIIRSHESLRKKKDRIRALYHVKLQKPKIFRCWWRVSGSVRKAFQDCENNFTIILETDQPLTSIPIEK